jgi:hypothetical protein
LSALMYPEVKDATTLGPRFSQPQFLPIGIEGQADAAGTGAINTIYNVTTPAQADTLFGPAASLSALAKFVLGRGVPAVQAVASKKASVPLLAERQISWALQESDPNLRIRLTDSGVSADIAALADSCENAELINHKQICFVGQAAGTTLATLLTAATSVSSKRAVLVGPGIYDESGVLLSGMFAAAAVAAIVATNPDIADDLDTLSLPGFTGIETDASGMPLLRKKVTSGSAVNDFENALTGGISPLRSGRNGGVEITHLRMAYVTDTTYDALMTRLIVDQLFIDVRDYVEDNLFLRRGNTPDVRNDLKAGVEALLAERSNWVRPKNLPDGSVGYGVSVIPSTDLRQVTIGYQGVIVRGIQKVLVDAKLEIPV